ncbi:Rieske 2Fe-2S domain-containing protein [Rhodococcus jostii]|uniref:Carbazole 1,9a-dioxygenase, terminal dioxygenase component n=1 Tax=Rhodococcus jostii TaxID=132919 RepID=A0A1H4IT09_RHOJO|nr:Rieske 2Fe-2S domain-containing protein [Rhodococcus jostii]SEB37133.1 carbazole 1,9a-dioxygenase, terminal dioxygenase component [Rhodococcus jostii]
MTIDATDARKNDEREIYNLAVDPTTRREKPWERYLEAELGFRNHWYPAFFSHELVEADVSDIHGEPAVAMKAEILLGERILFRRVEGKVLAVEDRCLHRGVALSARPECYTADTITCWYHGFTYAMDSGALTSVITDPKSRLVGKLAIKSYPVEEAAGLVWVYIGDGDPHPLANDVQPGVLDDDMVVYPFGWAKVVDCNWRTAAENGFDPAHAYIHRNSAWVTDYKVPMVLGDTAISSRQGMKIMTEDDAPKGVLLERGGGTAVWSADVAPDLTVSSRFDPSDEGVLEGMSPDVSVWMPCGLWVDPMPEPGMIHLEWYVPVDRYHHRYIITWAKRVTNEDEKEQFITSTKEKWSDYIPAEFNDDDVFARKAMAEFYDHGNGWRDERLFSPDVVITNWRKLVNKHARGVQTAEHAWATYTPPTDD